MKFWVSSNFDSGEEGLILSSYDGSKRVEYVILSEAVIKKESL